MRSNPGYDGDDAAAAGMTLSWGVVQGVDGGGGGQGLHISFY